MTKKELQGQGLLLTIALTACLAVPILAYVFINLAVLCSQYTCG
jgi:hypothetical protein